ncbi:MAG: hypothetical protein ABL985_21670 [Casimicrobium sp.]
MSELSFSGHMDRSALPGAPDMVARFREYTMLGDMTGDAYAALMPQYGFRPLVDMLILACDKGLDEVPNASPDLIALIRELERIPDWFDIALVEEGARADRNAAANISPFTIRGRLLRLSSTNIAHSRWS